MSLVFVSHARTSRRAPILAREKRRYLWCRRREAKRRYTRKQRRKKKSVSRNGLLYAPHSLRVRAHAPRLRFLHAQLAFHSIVIGRARSCARGGVLFLGRCLFLCPRRLLSFPSCLSGRWGLRNHYVALFCGRYRKREEPCGKRTFLHVGQQNEHS